MKLLSRFALSFVTLIYAVHLFADISVEQGKTVKLDIPVKTEFTCNIRVSYGGKDNDVVVDVKTGKGVYDFNADSAGVVEIRWEGKMKFRGLKTLAGCPGSGSLAVKVVEMAASESEQAPQNSASAKVVNEATPMAADGKEAGLKLSKNPENAPVKTQADKNDVIDLTSLAIPKFAAGWSSAWSSSKELISYCLGKNQEGKLVLKGTEFSFRTNSDADVTGACSNWAWFTEGVVAGTNLKNKKWKEGRFWSNWQGDVGDFPVEFVSLHSDTSALGWYVSSGNGVFSEGTFGSPIGEMPKAGLGVYEGYVGYGTSALINPIQFATVDFESNTINIRANFNGMGELRSIITPSPLKINPKNGFFTGDVVSSGGNARVPLTRKGTIVGYVGGEDGEIIHATYRTGSSNSGADFVLGQRIKLETVKKSEQIQGSEKIKEVGAAPAQNAAQSNPYKTAEKCLGKAEKLAIDLSKIIGFKYSGLKDCGGLYIWTLNDGGYLLLQSNNKYGWKRSATAGQYYCFDNYTKRKYRGKWDSCDL